MGLIKKMNQWSECLVGIRLTRMVDLLAGIPLVNLLALTRRRQKWPDLIHRVGVFCSPTTGDTVLFSAALLDIRSFFGPTVEIVHFCGLMNRSAAQLLNGADRCVVIQPTKPLSAMRKIRDERLDLFFDFSSWQRVTAFLALTSHSRYTIGFRSAGQHRHSGYDIAVEHRADQHELENYRDLLRGVAIPVHAEPQVTVSDGDLPHPWQQENDIVVFHLWPAGGPMSMREWPKEHWIALAKKIAQPNTIFAITGAPAEIEQSRAFAQQLSATAVVRAVPFEGEGGLVHLVRLLRRARLVVSVNTGIMHLAAVVGAPTISLNGPTAGHRWGPRGKQCIGVSPADGSGGFLHLGFELGRRREDVMKRISPDQVAEAASLLRCGTQP